MRVVGCAFSASDVAVAACDADDAAAADDKVADNGMYSSAR